MRTDAELLEKLLIELSLEIPTVVHEDRSPNKRVAKDDEETLLRFRRLFDQKYSVSTPLELMSI
ncbi:hypothetical protein ACWYXN_19315 [Janthinobacterium aestuarii]|uniref:Uncharacterized protein n=1 Tax=Janthinobacterium lividum TaxID=29581 RepID=A0A5C4NMB8_9BURK|nr:hypothetical protein [Janthinobacterium lividum]TNC75904.1 hypothetical protein FHI69_16805 [Janthinobacterium lividum]